MSDVIARVNPVWSRTALRVSRTRSCWSHLFFSPPYDVRYGILP